MSASVATTNLRVQNDLLPWGKAGVLREVVGMVAVRVLYSEAVDVDRRAGWVADGDRLRLEVHGAGHDEAGWRDGEVVEWNREVFD